MLSSRCLPMKKVMKKMKKGLHPQSTMVRVMMTDGSTYRIRSFVPCEKDLWKLDQDNRSHPYWFAPFSAHRKQMDWQERGQRAKFNKRFQIQK